MVMSLPNHFLTDEVLCFSLCFTSDMSPKPKVVVIGAGIAGLSAASKLHKSGQVEVCVLEASERVGGRIHSGKIGENKVEFGAAWIHGTKGNPVFDLACDLGLLSKSDKEWMNEDSRTKSKINTQLGQHIDDQLLTEVWNVFYSLTCDQAFFFFAAEGGRKKKESLIQLLVESSAAPQLKCLSTRVSAMPSDKSEPITIYRKSLRWRESAEARSGHEVCKHLCKLPFVSRPIRKKSRFWTFYRRLDK